MKTRINVPPDSQGLAVTSPLYQIHFDGVLAYDEDWWAIGVYRLGEWTLSTWLREMVWKLSTHRRRS